MNPTSYLKITCICCNISYTILSELIKEGKKLEELQQEYGVGTFCKKCLPYIEEKINANT